MDNQRVCKLKFRKRKAASNVTFCMKTERNASNKKILEIIQKPLSERTIDDKEILNTCKDTVQKISQRLDRQKKLKERCQEFEDPAEVLDKKCEDLAKAISSASNLVVYTGAGISTAAKIPDYRGSNGIWTLLDQGKDIGCHDLSQAEPTLTHMALYRLYREGLLGHVVSQNCDGLHLRSGLPRPALSEVHGDMFIEVCVNCKPNRHYLRMFDVTEHTARFNHKTLRLCYACHKPLKDTIVHFGERGKLQWPINWSTACKHAEKTDVILCLGSSLRVLKKYPWLWSMDRPAKKRPKLYIVNLQWTPKDDQATLKINGKCDEIMKKVMSILNLDIPKYQRCLDPIFHHATMLVAAEEHTTVHPVLAVPTDDVQKTESTITKCEKIELDISNNKNNTKMCSGSKDLIQPVDLSLVKLENNTSIADQSESINSPSCSSMDIVPSLSNFWRPFIEGVDPNSLEGRNMLSLVEPIVPYLNPFFINNMETLGLSPTPVDQFYKNFVYQACIGLAAVEKLQIEKKLTNNLKKKKKDISEDKDDIKKTDVSISRYCTFCHPVYGSTKCLFYHKYESKFKEDVANCLCCDDDTDEEDENELKTEDIADKNDEVIEKAKVTAGWFGKGYKKRIKKKK
ncbi:NAD-dependent protein deacetylase sirtuin-7 [Melanaphis sacchari]|uniref:protein acetyllysine N-acetyltransferase n=1 Tax=Melanaphis sacchari TaxID=742174 RepID=A0A2H8TRP7_9HEMI|nr:NAD-dependent protein deacetylase sirtuin-7 [Melanaphis sacchari]